MKSKLWGFAVFGFWLAMMAALVRIEYLDRLAPWAEVPPARVFQKILDNPDSAMLNIYEHGQLVGFCRWETKPATNAYRVSGELSLAVTFAGARMRVRVNGNSLVSRRHEFEEFHLRGNVGDTRFDLAGNQHNRQVAFAYDLGDGTGLRKLQLDPTASADVAATLGVPVAAVPAGGLAGQTRAYYGRFTVGDAVQRTYIIETKVNEALWAKLWVDEAGEVLQVETSAGWTMRSDLLEEENRRPTKRRQKP